jgi:putative membrane protein
MKRAALLAALALVPAGWALSGLGMTGHMAAHMIAVALAAPLLAYVGKGTRLDPATRWPRIVTPMSMMLVELATVWGWHLPFLRALSGSSFAFAALEQATFLFAGMLLWSAVLHAPSRAAGIGALLLTSMHMTLLGVLVGLAPRPLYGHAMHHSSLGLQALADQQLGGVVMLAIGAGSYLLGGLLLLGRLLRDPVRSTA